MFNIMFFLFCLLIIHVNGDSRKCDRMDILYTDMGCAAESADEGCCPEYSCLKYKIPCGKCRFQNEFYKPGDSIPATGCNLGCRCSDRNEKPNKNGTIDCALVKCFIPPTDDDSYIYYNDLDQCCPSGNRSKCESTVTCNVDGQDYLEGQIFKPEGTCYKCICHKGFCGEYEEPFCKKADCQSELKYAKEISQKDAPVFDREGCCPLYFVSPCDFKIIDVIKGVDENTRQCSFGKKKKLNVGDHFTASHHLWDSTTEVECYCETPPLLTCYE